MHPAKKADLHLRFLRSDVFWQLVTTAHLVPAFSVYVMLG